MPLTALLRATKALARVFVGHQVNVALAVLHFLVGNAVELVGHGAQALGRAGARWVAWMDSSPVLVLNTVPSAATMSPRSQCLNAAYSVLANVFALDINLDAAGRQRCILQGAKAGLAHHALEHHAPGHFGRTLPIAPQGLGGLAVVRRRTGLRPVVSGLKSFGKGHALALGLRSRRALSFSRRSSNQLVFVLNGCGSGGCCGF